MRDQEFSLESDNHVDWRKKLQPRKRSLKKDDEQPARKKKKMEETISMVQPLDQPKKSKERGMFGESNSLSNVGVLSSTLPFSNISKV